MAVLAKLKNGAKTQGKIMGFETTSVKSSDIVLHVDESFRPQVQNLNLKNEAYFHVRKDFLGYVFSAWRN